MKPRTVIGPVMIAGGAVLALAFWDLRIAWFQGGPLGIALIVLGLVEFLDSRRAKDGKRQGILTELRDDLLGPRKPKGPDVSAESPPLDDDQHGDDIPRPR